MGGDFIGKSIVTKLAVLTTATSPYLKHCKLKLLLKSN